MQQPTMRRMLAAVGSLKLTSAGIGLLIVCVMASYLLDRTGSSLGWSGWWLAIPLILLAINLGAAILIDPRINSRPGLLVFHIALLSIFALGAYGELAGFHGRVELVSGQSFDSASVVQLQAGPLHHTENLDAVRFAQGEIRVEYAPDIIRQATSSTVTRATGPESFGDNVPLRFHDYVFYTTSNKGIAAVVIWTATGMEPRVGAIHFPSYPLNEWRQLTQWQPDRGPELNVALRGLQALDPGRAFVLDESMLGGVELTVADRPLRPGQSVSLPDGLLTYQGPRLWMGYEIRSTPLTVWTFLCALVGIFGIGWHFLAPPRVVRTAAFPVMTRQADNASARGA